LNSSSDPTDLDQRVAAVDIERSVIVQAPAGSGKTTLLVQRFLNLLTVVDRPEEVLAITFTRKAAAEMLERVVTALAEDTARSRAIRTRSTARGWHLDTQPGRLRIQTIDAFCVGLVQRLPISSGLGDRLRIVEDGEPYYREAIDRTFERLGHSDELNSELIGLLALFDNDFEKARASMSTMLAKRDQWLEVVALTLRAGQADRQVDDSRRRAITGAIEAGVRALHTNAISDVIADLGDRLRNELADVASSAALRLGVDWPGSGLPTDLEQWHFIAELITTRGGQPRIRLGSAQGFNDAGHANQYAKARLRMLIEDLDRHDMILRLASLRLLPPLTLDAREAHAIVNVATGLATTEPELEDVMKALRASKLEILWNVGLPRTMPYFFASLKVAVTLAFVGTVISETVASNRGIGNVMMIASSSFDVPLVFAGLTILAALGVALYVIFSFIEGRVTGWALRKDEFAVGA